jgi:hypothetical protein
MVSDCRNGIYRSVFAALVGLTLLGASPSHDNQGQQQRVTKAEISSAREPAALHKSDTTYASEKPCAKGQDDHTSDLCAQWKAADATQSATDATWLFGYVGSAIGLMTLIAAIAAAVYARGAAIHTEISAKSFVETERAILHAIGGTVGEINTDGHPCVAIKIFNRGRAAGKVIEFGSKQRGTGIPENAQKRWTVIAPDSSINVAAFHPPDKGQTLVVDCWIRYRTIGPDIHVSHFTAKVFFHEAGHEDLVLMSPWFVEASNPNGHPDDT